MIDCDERPGHPLDQDFEDLVTTGYKMRLVRPDRCDEAPRHGSSGWIRRWIGSVNDTLKGQLDLERHGGRTTEGLYARITQRLLAMPSASGTTGPPAPRSGARLSHTTTDLISRPGPGLADRFRRRVARPAFLGRPDDGAPGPGADGYRGRPGRRAPDRPAGPSAVRIRGRALARRSRQHRPPVRLIPPRPGAIDREALLLAYG